MDKLEAPCRKCKRTISADSYEAWLAALKEHFRTAHGITGSFYKDHDYKCMSAAMAYKSKYSAERAANQKFPNETEEERQQRLEHLKQLRKAKKGAQVLPMPLPGCPFCGIEFAVKAGGKYEVVKLNTCPKCGKRYYFAE